MNYDELNAIFKTLASEEARNNFEFDLHKLAQEFTYACADFPDAITNEKKSCALEFAQKVLFVIGPEARQVKNNTPDKVWKFRFVKPLSNSETKTLETTMATVATYKNSTPKNTGVFINGRINLTIKQASLLSLCVIKRIQEETVQEGRFILTPLAGAIFNKNDIPALSKKLKTSPNDVLNIINASCQPGGQYLPDSRLCCAIAATMAATQNMKNKTERNRIIVKTIKQYLNAGKINNEANMFVFKEYAKGGIPADLDPTFLIQTFQQIQASASRPTFTQMKSLDVEGIETRFEVFTPQDTHPEFEEAEAPGT